MSTYEALSPLVDMGRIASLIVAEGEERYGDKFNLNVYALSKAAEFGNLRIFVVKEDDKIIGFANFLLSQHLFMANVHLAECIAFYLMPEKRGGTYARKLMQFSIQHLKIHDRVTQIMGHTNAWTKFEKFYERMGFEKTDTLMVKEL